MTTTWGLHRVSMVELERGNRPPRPHTLKLLAEELLKVGTQDLLESPPNRTGGCRHMSDKNEDEAFRSLNEDARQALEEEQRLKDRWIEHVNDVYLADSPKKLDITDAYRVAKAFLEGILPTRHADTLDLAEDLFEAHERMRNADRVIIADFAITQPELIDELNKPLDPVLWKKFMD